VRQYNKHAIDAFRGPRGSRATFGGLAESPMNTYGMAASSEISGGPPETARGPRALPSPLAPD